MIIIAWLQQILNHIALLPTNIPTGVPSADSTDNIQMRDVIGNKSDAEVAVVGTGASIINYLKALVRELDQRSVAKTASKQMYNSYTSWQDVVNIADRGVLTGIIACEYDLNADIAVYIQITIDGTQIFSYPIGHVGPNHTETPSFPFNHRFNSSLRVQAKYDPGAGTGYGYVHVSYTKKT